MSLAVETRSSMTIVTHTQGLESTTCTQVVSSSTVTATTSPQEDTAAKPPPRVYDLYSWRTKAPQTRLVYIRDLKTANEEIARFKPGPCGFDLEWRPVFRKGQKENPVALVQLANDDTVLLIQVTAIRVFPESLQSLLWNPAYIKCGVGIQGDCKKLWNDYQVNVRNCVDLALLARTVDNARWKGKYSQPIGLARLCEAYEELSLRKGKTTRSNWEAVLTEAQIQYAADDCHSGLSLFQRLFPLTLEMHPRPLPSYYSFDLYQGLAYVPAIGAPELLWQPYNPFYDPGPPPEPKPPKEKKERKERRNRDGEDSPATAADGSGNAVEGSTPRAAPARARHPLQQSAEGQTRSSSSAHYGHEHQGQRGQPFTHRGHRWRSPSRGNAGEHGAPAAAMTSPAQPSGDPVRIQHQHQHPDAGSSRPFRGRGRGRFHYRGAHQPPS